MELSTNLEQKDETTNATPVIYTAYGWVAGVFQPGKKKRRKKLQGILITEDGEEIPATLDWYLLHRIKKQMQDESKIAEFWQSVHQWKIYPRTQPLHFDITKIRALPSDEQKQAKNSPPIELDNFRVVGEIRYIANGKVVMRIERNEKVPNRSNNNHPLYLKLSGSIPTGEIGQIWELEVWRCGTKLTISKAKVYQPSEKDIRLFNLLNEQKKASQTSQSDEPALEASLALDQVKATVAEHIDRASLPELQQEENKHSLSKKAAVTNTAKAQVQTVTTVASKEKKHGNSAKPKSATPIADKCEPKVVQQQSSRFTVQVNGQVFIGQDSVALNRRVLFIDSKPVAQSKLAVVVGQPKAMQADGSVSTGSGRSVLIGK